MLCGGGNASGFIAINALAVTHGLLARCRLPVTNRGKRVSDYFRAGTTVYLELWSSFPTTPFLDSFRVVDPPGSWSDHATQARLSVLIRPNSISSAYCVFQHSVKPTRQKNDSAESNRSPIAVYSCSRNTCP